MWRARILVLLSLFLLSNGTGRLSQTGSVSSEPFPAGPDRQEYQACRLAHVKAAAAYALQQESFLGERPSRRIVALVSRESQRYGLRPLLVLGLILAESGGDRWAVSSEGARGLMQVLPATGRFVAFHLSEEWRGPISLHEIETNIRYGTWYLFYLQQVFPGNRQAVLAAYNWGPGEIQDRLEAGQLLPQVYPQRIREARARIRERMYDYDQVYPGRGLCGSRD